jgi:hypothetical protein
LIRCLPLYFLLVGLRHDTLKCSYTSPSQD